MYNAIVVLVLAICLIACGSDGGSETTNISNQCFTKNNIAINCEGVAEDSKQACAKCDEDYQECFTKPESNGLIDDSQCLEIYELCLKSNECE